MTYLTEKHIRAFAAKDRRIDQIECDEPGKLIVWLADGYTWDRLDGNRSVEGFVISNRNADEADRDTVAYWNECVANIETITA
jgi:hypothetical protein